MQDDQAGRAALLESFHLSAQQVTGLPPEVRDGLLDWVRTWGLPEELLALVTLLREAHGPLLFLLDHQANALWRLGRHQEALDVVERRQRRSTTIASQGLEGLLLAALQHPAHARAVADDICRAYARNISALAAAAAIYTAVGAFTEADSLLAAYLDYRPGDLEATLSQAQLAVQAQQRTLAADYAERLGAGVPAGIEDEQLQRMLSVLDALGFPQRAQAVELELGRRRGEQLARLRSSLSALFDQPGQPDADLESVYRRRQGPESIPVDPAEVRRIQMEAIRHFGFGRLRPGQPESVAAVLRGESILVVMPTGAGKSLCYQLPALMLPRVTLVISPLVALMKDQVESLPARARRQATFVNSTLSEAELEARLSGIARGEYKLVYAAPERLRQRSFLHTLRAAGLDLFVVDEAHCVSLWGHDFRPDYLFLQEARHELGNPPALAMTATAPPLVRDEIVDHIRDDAGADERLADPDPAVRAPHRPHVLALDIFRNNLHLSAFHFHNEEEKLNALLQLAVESAGSGIVYVSSRHKSESLAQRLRMVGVAAEAYHAGLADRGAIQDRFMADETRVVVATIAFGMGIDKPDIRFIVHFHPSRSLAAYYQEVGRAGRDGKLSQGILFYSNNDWANLRRWARADEISMEFLESVYSAVATQLGRPIDDHGQVVPAGQPDEVILGPVDAQRLQQVLGADETTVRVAVSLLERAELLSRGFDLPQELELGRPAATRTASAVDPGSDDRDILRLLNGLALRPGHSAAFRTADVASYMGWPLHQVEALLHGWHRTGRLQLKARRRAMLIEMTPPPPDGRQRLQRLLTQAAAVAQRRIDDMIGYATAETCRHGYISGHFGSPPRSRCEVCDNCTGIRPTFATAARVVQALPDDADIEPMILDCLLSLPKPVGRSGLARVLAGSLRAPARPDQARHHGRLQALDEAAIIQYIDDLVEDHRLRQYERQGYLVLAATMRGRAEAEYWLADHPELAAVAPAAVAAAAGATPDEADGRAEEPVQYTRLQKALWRWRQQRAREMGQPSYMVMGNETMLDIAAQRPQTETELIAVPGMGEQRLHHYGAAILDLVKLNPAEPGDTDLLELQRTRQVHRPAQGAPAIGPAVERRILMKMQELRQRKAVSAGIRPDLVANTGLLKAIARQAPSSPEALLAIPGFRSSGLHREIEQIVALVAEVLANQA